jgi:hypothetical protein
MRSLLAWSSLAAAVSVAVDARAACEVENLTPTGTITGSAEGQRFSFTATGDDCDRLIFVIDGHGRGLSRIPHASPRTGPGPQWYSVDLKIMGLAFVTKPGVQVLDWRIQLQPEVGAPHQVLGRMSNELDMDRDGVTRSEGDTLTCDQDRHRSPLLPEICGDHIDNDCDGVSLACAQEGDVAPDDAWVTIEGVHASQRVGASVAPAGDVNGDGVADLAVAAQAGSSYLFLGPPASGTTAEADATFRNTPRRPSYYGYETRGVGDQDHDGYGDLLVSDPTHDKTGAAFVLLGPVTGVLDFEVAAAATLAGHYDGALFGRSAAGDINGDGTGDLVIGAPLTRETGAAYVFYGPVTTGDLDPSSAGATVRGTYADSEGQHGWTGGTVATGDIDGDGIDDVAIGAEGHSYRGMATLLFGPVMGTFTEERGDVTVGGAVPNAQLGIGLSISGDLDADGLGDLAIGTTSNDGGVAIFYADSILGASELDVGAADAAISVEERLAFGWTLDTGGDLDADGSDDLVVGAPLMDGGDGGAFGFYGPVSGLLATSAASFTLAAPGAYDGIGFSVAFPGDADDDGTDDLAIGGLLAGTSTEAGAVYLFRGGSLRAR